MAIDDAPHLQLVRSTSTGTARRVGTHGSVTLAATPALERFLGQSAERGLDPTNALRLGIERELALLDAGAIGLDRHAARHMLCERASRARVARRLDAEDAAYLRTLSAARALAPPRLTGSLTVILPPALLGRARGVVSAAVFEDGAVTEMVTWEIAARAQGRALGEWALLVLAMRLRTATG
jgi:hypothetical protein